MSALRVVVADDQTVVREGLVVLVGLLPDVEVVAAAADGEQAVALVGEHRPDVVLMDLRMPRLDGVAATRLVRERHPGVHVVVLTTYSDDESVFAALRAGARGYLTKDATATEIEQALRTVAAGQALLAPDVQRRLVEELAVREESPPPRAVPDGLTAREAEVLALIADGLSNSEIAVALVVTEATVKTHVNHLLAKTGRRDRAQLVAYAYRHGVAGG
ncbi:response regulator transcription factor [Saccharopolyspora rosea]|uniref:Response regulator n=1 Tax=Saccharopolyspora rosea TaxID=524884 RepID=A0ABW3G0L6_9PSEU